MFMPNTPVHDKAAGVFEDMEKTLLGINFIQTEPIMEHLGPKYACDMLYRKYCGFFLGNENGLPFDENTIQIQKRIEAIQSLKERHSHI